MFILFQFPEVRNISTTILASAGVLGIVVGFAAQSTLGNFIAGVAISFSQPVRLNDTVIVKVQNIVKTLLHRPVYSVVISAGKASVYAVLYEMHLREHLKNLIALIALGSIIDNDNLEIGIT